jgi:hypothetical protein
MVSGPCLCLQSRGIGTAGGVERASRVPHYPPGHPLSVSRAGGGAVPWVLPALPERKASGDLANQHPCSLAGQGLASGQPHALWTAFLREHRPPSLWSGEAGDSFGAHGCHIGWRGITSGKLSNTSNFLWCG